jgi:hypothetical protein
VNAQPLTGPNISDSKVPRNPKENGAHTKKQADKS